MLSTLNQIIKSEHDTVGNGKHEIRKGYTQFFRILPTFFRVFQLNVTVIILQQRIGFENTAGRGLRNVWLPQYGAGVNFQSLGRFFFMSKFSFTSIKGNPRKTPSPKSTPPRNQGLILLMEEILHHQGCIKPVNENYLSTGAGFQPSTVAGHILFQMMAILSYFFLISGTWDTNCKWWFFGGTVQMLKRCWWKKSGWSPVDTGASWT